MFRNEFHKFCVFATNTKFCIKIVNYRKRLNIKLVLMKTNAGERLPVAI